MTLGLRCITLPRGTIAIATRSRSSSSGATTAGRTSTFRRKPTMLSTYEYHRGETCTTIVLTPASPERFTCKFDRLIEYACSTILLCIIYCSIPFRSFLNFESRNGVCAESTPVVVRTYTGANGHRSHRTGSSKKTIQFGRSRSRHAAAASPNERYEGETCSLR